MLHFRRILTLRGLTRQHLELPLSFDQSRDIVTERSGDMGYTFSLRRTRRLRMRLSAQESDTLCRPSKVLTRVNSRETGYPETAMWEVTWLRVINGPLGECRRRSRQTSVRIADHSDRISTTHLNMTFVKSSAATSGAALGVSVHKRRTRARLGRTGPARPAVFAQDAPDKQQDR